MLPSGNALVTALDDTAILGLTTNLGFLRALAASDAFRDNEVHTAWLDTHPEAIRPAGADVAAVLGAWALAHEQAQDPGPFGTADGWRLAGPPAPTPVELVVDGETALFSVGSAELTSGDRTWRVHPIASDAGILRLEVDDIVHEAAVRVGAHAVDVAYLGHTFSFTRPDAFGPGAGSAASDGTVVAPMPGTVLAVSGRWGRRSPRATFSD